MLCNAAAESAVDNLDDVISVKFIQEIIDWCGSHPVISKVSDTSRVYLCGHSRVSFDNNCIHDVDDTSMCSSRVTMLTIVTCASASARCVAQV